MISENDLREIVKLQRSEILGLDLGTERENLNDVKMIPNFALIISGIRRCGKSTLLAQLLSKQKKFYYLNLEDPRLEGFGLTDFTKIEKILKEDYGAGGVYFFDEIQNVKKWENFIRYLVDKKEKVVITGSNASLLSRELGTKLTGRHLDIQLFPFSYNEFLKLSNFIPSSKTYEDFLQKGGLPEYLKKKEISILNRLLSDVVMMDIVNRFSIRNSALLKKIAIYLISHVGKELSFNSLKKMFQVKSVQSVIDYVSYFEDSYLLFAIPRFSYSYRQQQVNPKKIYSIDNGLSNVNSVSFSKDRDRMLENSVFLHIRRRHEDIFYFQKENECDFIIRERDKIVAAVQVCWELNNENMKRETNGLLEAMNEFGLKKAFILTFDQEDKFNFKDRTIIVQPAWKWTSRKVKQ